MYKLNIGDEYKANCGTYCKVIQRIDVNKVLIEWQDEFKHRQIARPNRVMNGKVYNPYFRYTFGIGYVGFGKYPPSKNEKLYSLWRSIFTRCYNKDYHKDKPTYIGCTVSDVWHNFQNFAEWCESQSGYGLKDYELDKDLLLRGNKIYGPEYCCFVPSYVNSIFSLSDDIRGEPPIGVSLGKYTKTKGQRYIAQVKSKRLPIKTLPRYIGSFSSIEEAHKGWQVAKSWVIQETLKIYSKEIAFNSKIADRLLDEAWNLLYNSSIGKETKSFYGRYQDV